MNYEFHPLAEQEFNHAIDFYESRVKNLGHEFAAEVYSTIKRIRSRPTIWPFYSGRVRRIMTARFPYAVLYTIEERHIRIVAVMHLHRDPDYWRDR